MKIDNVVLSNNQIYELLSKTEPNFYSVFIAPNGVVNPESDIKDLNLNCKVSDLTVERLIIEYYDDKQEAVDRINDFVDRYETFYYYVVCYKNGIFIIDNQEKME